MRFTAKSPTRIDFAGGTLDCWPLFLMVNESQTVNMSIDIFTHAEIEVLSDSRVIVHMSDIGYQKEFANVEAAIQSPDSAMDMLRYHFQLWRPKQGFAISTRSESPVGGGLGGSSSLTISLLKVFCQWFGESWSLAKMVEVAHNIEAKILKKPTGTQDYIPAVQYGLNVIHYGVHGPEAILVPFAKDYFTQRMFLVYTGQPHHSGLNNWQVIKAAVNGESQTMTSLLQIKSVAESMSKAVEKQRWEALPALFVDEFNARVGLSEGFSSEKIEQLRDLIFANKASAIKICGAGGGGCVMVWSEPEHKAKVVAACQKEGFQVLQVQPVVGE